MITADMMQVGNFKGEEPQRSHEERSHFSLWVMNSAPLVLGFDMGNASTCTAPATTLGSGTFNGINGPAMVPGDVSDSLLVALCFQTTAMDRVWPWITNPDMLEISHAFV